MLNDLSKLPAQALLFLLGFGTQKDEPPRGYFMGLQRCIK